MVFGGSWVHRARYRARPALRASPRFSPLRRAGLLVLGIVWLIGASPALAATAPTSLVVHVGLGAARLTRPASGPATLYVNLRGLAPGRWNEHLWSGSCGDLGVRLAVLPGLAVPASGRIARTNPLTSTAAKAGALRLVHGSTVLCASFSTAAPPPEQTAVMVGAGDIAGCGFSGDNTTASMIEQIPGTVFTLGDNVYPDGTAQQFADCYADSWGRFKDRTHPAPGNHDYNTPGATGYFGYFGAAAGDPRKGWYTFDVGAWRVYVLNSDCDQVGGCNAGSAQEVWLKSQLAADPHRCVAAIWHHPRFSSRADDTRLAAFWQDLYDARAELVLSGHDHDYERFAPLDPQGQPDVSRGIREIVAGTGGVGHNTFGTIKPGSEVRNDDTLGILKLTLTSTAYTWDFIPVPGKTFTDHGGDTCH